MRIVITNISPWPTQAGAMALGSDWYVVCPCCENAGDDHIIEAENKQHALDHAVSHHQLAHNRHACEIVLEEQLVLSFARRESIQ